MVVKIVRWPEDKKAAVSLRFDDSLESHVRTVIPLLNVYDLKATFLVNPGKRQFKKHETFWTEVAPQQGHRLGNHTMHHRGARNLEQAEDEIAEAASLIRGLYPDQSPLMVFASGGGEKWEGKYWRNADIKYKSLVSKYQMIDLYDGNHPYISADSRQTAEKLAGHLEKVLREGGHQTITFHHVGSKRIKDILKGVLFDSDNAFSRLEFERFLEILNSLKNRLWIAPLVEAIKYEREVAAASISNVRSDHNSLVFQLNISTDPELYDHPLEYVIGNAQEPRKATQDGREMAHRMDPKGLWIYLEPKSSEIRVTFPED